MSKFDQRRMADIAEYEWSAKMARNLSQLARITDATARQFGFHNYALADNAELGRKAENSLFLTTYPRSWVEEYVTRQLCDHDPIILACHMSSASGFTWDRLPTLNRRQSATLKGGRAHGLVNGFAMPLRMKRGLDATFTVTRRSADPFSREDLITARMIGLVAFDRGQELLGSNRIAADPVSLTARQIDCIALIGRGKTDREISSILHISLGTVRAYVSEAMERYGVSKRTLLVLRAVREGLIDIDALLIDPEE